MSGHFTLYYFCKLNRGIKCENTNDVESFSLKRNVRWLSRKWKAIEEVEKTILLT